MVCPQMNHKVNLEFHSITELFLPFPVVGRAAHRTIKEGDGHCPLLIRATTVSSSFTIHWDPCLYQGSYLYTATSLGVQQMNSIQHISKQEEAEMKDLNTGHCFSCFKYIISTRPYIVNVIIPILQIENLTSRKIYVTFPPSYTQGVSEQGLTQTSV